MCAPPLASAMSRRLERSTCRGAGLCDFLDRLYTNTISNLAVGRAHYGLMLREDGIVFDDGTTSRLADEIRSDDDHGVAAAVLEHMEFHRPNGWPELDVSLLGDRPVGVDVGRRAANAGGAD